MRRLACALLNTRGVVELRQGDLNAAGASLEEALSLARSIGSRYTESEALSNCAQHALYRGTMDLALARAQEALRAAQLAGEQTLSGFAWMALARVQEAGGAYETAAAAYQNALALRQALGHPGLILETQAGLARVARCLGAAEEARALVEVIWTALAPAVVDEQAGAPLYGTEEPCRILLTCHDVFRVQGDPRAGAMLTYADACVQAWASTISEERLRRSFLEDVPAHRDLRHALAR
jgi:tetratricopeptide (TPR) repeat protein